MPSWLRSVHLGEEKVPIFGKTTVQDSWPMPRNVNRMKNIVKSENFGNFWNFYVDLKSKFKDSKRNNLFIFEYF